jgi:hypothetical protein
MTGVSKNNCNLVVEKIETNQFVKKGEKNG